MTLERFCQREATPAAAPKATPAAAMPVRPPKVGACCSLVALAMLGCCGCTRKPAGTKAEERATKAAAAAAQQRSSCCMLGRLGASGTQLDKHKHCGDLLLPIGLASDTFPNKLPFVLGASKNPNLEIASFWATGTTYSCYSLPRPSWYIPDGPCTSFPISESLSARRHDLSKTLSDSLKTSSTQQI